MLVRHAARRVLLSRDKHGAVRATAGAIFLHVATSLSSSSSEFVVGFTLLPGDRSPQADTDRGKWNGLSVRKTTSDPGLGTFLMASSVARMGV